MIFRRRRRLIRWTVLGLATAALVAPTAQAVPLHDGDAGSAAAAVTDRGPSSASVLGEFVKSPATAATQAPATHPDNRAGVHGPGAFGIEEPVVASPSSGSFDWGDAAIGASGMLGIALLLAGATLVVTRRGRQGQLSST
jgi:hypothetical protein